MQYSNILSSWPGASCTVARQPAPAAPPAPLRPAWSDPGSRRTSAGPGRPEQRTGVEITQDIDLKLLQIQHITHIEGLHDALDEGVGPGVLQAEAGPPQQPDRGGGAGEDDEGVAGPSDRPAAV